jgi:hypothetical protein
MRAKNDLIQEATVQATSEINPGVLETGVVEKKEDPSERVRERDFCFLPIPKSKRHNPDLKTHEQFIFTWKTNLVLAGAAVSLDIWPC